MKNHKKNPIRHKGLWIFALALLLALLSWGAAALFPGKVPLLTNLVGIVVTPLERGAAAAAGWIGKGYGYLYEYDALVGENAQLKLRLAELERQAREAESSERENERLRRLLGLSEKRTDIDWETAVITSRGSSNWSSTLTLNKGSAHGIEVSDCVVTDTMQLVGVIAEVGYNWSVAITVTDPDFEMGALISRTEEFCITEGNFALMGQGKLRLSYFPDKSSVMRGDVVVTSGSSIVYPAGLTIGTVEEVRLDDAGISRHAVLEPFAPLSELTQVFIIKGFDIVQ